MTLTTPRRAPTVLEDLVIDGARVRGAGPGIDVLDPATGETLATVAEATVGQAEAALAAARRAADVGPWPALAPAQRSAALHRFCDAFEARTDELVATIVAEVGTPLQLAEPLQVGSALTHLRHYADLAARDLARDLGPA